MGLRIGYTSFEVAFTFPGSFDKQATRLADRLDALQDAEGTFIWTLYDFAEVDSTVVGASPWVQRLQSSFGLYRSDGTEKPAAAVIRDRFLSGL